MCVGNKTDKLLPVPCRRRGKKTEIKAKKEGKREVGEGLKQDRIEGWGAGDRGEGEFREERAPKVEKMTKKLRRGDKKKGRECMIKERSSKQGILRGGGKKERGMPGWVRVGGGGGAGDDATSSVPLLLNLWLNNELLAEPQQKPALCFRSLMLHVFSF